MFSEILKLIIYFTLGFIGNVLLEKVKQKRKSICYQILPRFPLHGFGFYPKAEGKNAEIAGVWEFGGYTVTIENDGNEVIESQEIHFIFEDNSVIWRSYVTAIPEGVAARVIELPSEKPNIRNYKISYLNPMKKFKELVGFNFTVYNTKANPRIVTQGPNLLCHEYSVGLGYKIGFYMGSAIDWMIGLLMLLYFSNLLIFKKEISKGTDQVILIILLLYVVEFLLGYRLYSWYMKRKTRISKV